jgi:hypothetical protein
MSVCISTCSTINKSTGLQLINKTYSDHRRCWIFSMLCSHSWNNCERFTFMHWVPYDKQSKLETLNFNWRSSLQSVWGIFRRVLRSSRNYIQFLLNGHLKILFSFFYRHLWVDFLDDVGSSSSHNPIGLYSLYFTFFLLFTLLVWRIKWNIKHKKAYILAVSTKGCRFLKKLA